jgi:hypothetical protein
MTPIRCMACWVKTRTGTSKRSSTTMPSLSASRIVCGLGWESRCVTSGFARCGGRLLPVRCILAAHHALQIMTRLLGASVPPNPATNGPGLRPYHLVITNAGGLDDMEYPESNGRVLTGVVRALCDLPPLYASFMDTEHSSVLLQVAVAIRNMG